MNPLRQLLIDRGQLADGPHYEPGMTPCQLPHGTRVFRIFPWLPNVVPYWTVGR